MAETRVEFELAPGRNLSDIVAVTRAGLAVPGVAAALADDDRFDVVKALKPGGPAHGGRDLSQYTDDRIAAKANAIALQQSFVAHLTETKDGWVSAIELRNAAAVTMGGKAADFHVDRIRRSVDRLVRNEIRATFRKMWLLGKQYGGNFQPLTSDEEKQLQRLYREEYAYFENLLHDVDAKTFRMNLDRRVAMYGDAAVEAFNLGHLFADLGPDKWLSWKFSHDKEKNCPDCLYLSKGGRYRNGVYRAVELAKRGLVPKSNQLSCYTHCGCSLVPVTKPTGDPTGTPLAEMKLQGPQGSSFVGQGRENREKFATRVKRNKLNWVKRKR